MGIKNIYKHTCIFIFYHNLLSHAVVKNIFCFCFCFFLIYIFLWFLFRFACKKPNMYALSNSHQNNNYILYNKRLFILRNFNFFIWYYVVAKNVQQLLIVFWKKFVFFYISFIFVHDCMNKFYYAVLLECEFVEFYLCNGKAFVFLLELT